MTMMEGGFDTPSWIVAEMTMARGLLKEPGEHVVGEADEGAVAEGGAE